MQPMTSHGFNQALNLIEGVFKIYLKGVLETQLSARFSNTDLANNTRKFDQICNSQFIKRHVSLMNHHCCVRSYRG